METESLTLTDFLLARIAEDERDTRERWCTFGPTAGALFAKELELSYAKRRTIEHLDNLRPHEDEWMQILEFMAIPYMYHPDYREDWNKGRPQRGSACTLCGHRGPVVHPCPYDDDAEMVPGDEPLGKNGGHAAEGHEPRPAKCPPSPLTIPLTGGCWGCGRSWDAPGWVDTWIPDWAWERISPLRRSGDGSGHLCVHCITAALDALGLRDVPVKIAAKPYWAPGAP